MEAFEVLFCAMHGADIDRAPRVIGRLQGYLESKYTNLDVRVVLKYAVSRTHLRLRDLQRRLVESRGDAQSVRNPKRMRMLARSGK